MRRQRSNTTSQFLTAGITAAVVLIMLAPLRPGPVEMQTRHAALIPLLSTSGVADTTAFHRLAVSATTHAASAEPLSRKPQFKASP